MNKNIFNNYTLNALRTIDDSPAMQKLRHVNSTLNALCTIDDSPTMQKLRHVNSTLNALCTIDDSPAMQKLRHVEELQAIKALEVSQAFYKLTEQLKVQAIENDEFWEVLLRNIEDSNTSRQRKEIIVTVDSSQ